VGQLPTAEQDGDLHLVAVFEELLGSLGLRVEVVLADLRPQPNLLELDDLLVLAGLALLLRLLILEAAIVEQPTDGRDAVGGDFDEIQIQLAGSLERLEGRENPQLLAVCTNQPNLTSANALVDAKVFANERTPRDSGCPKL
jgi:hypothetical protein